MKAAKRSIITKEHLAFAREIGELASARAAESMRDMLACDIRIAEMNSGLMRVETLMEMTDDLQNAAVGVYARVEGPAPGHAVFLFPNWKIPELAKTTGESEEALAKAGSLIADIGDSVISSVLTALEYKTGLEFRPISAMPVADMAWAIVSSLIAFPFGEKEKALVISTRLHDGLESLDSLFLFIPDPGSLEIIREACTVPELASLSTETA